MQEILSYGFFQRAILAGIFIAIACAVLGVFLILRRDSMIGHGLSHVTFAGIALGLFLNIIPLFTALVIAVITGILIVIIKERAGLYGDAAIAIFSSTGFALGIILITLSNDFNVNLFEYLFGEILAIEKAEVWLSVVLAVAVVMITKINHKKFMYITFDRESALASGIKVKRLEIILTALTAITIVLGMKVVGILLVSALLVIPAASGLQLASNFRTAIIISSLTAFVSVTVGLILSYYTDLPASGVIVVLSFIIFTFTFIFRKK